MKIVVTSDFHGVIPPDHLVPPCDLLLIAGDCLGHGVWIRELSQWISRQPAKHVVGIAGNHDFIAQSAPHVLRDIPWVYLQDSGVTIDGLNIWGSPWAHIFGGWPFMLPDDELAEKWAHIPGDTHILMTHGPAYGILDKVHGSTSVGSHSLRDRIARLGDLKLFVSGHVHEAYGKVAIPFQHEGRVRFLPCVNGSFMDVHYRPVNFPILVEMDKLPAQLDEAASVIVADSSSWGGETGVGVLPGSLVTKQRRN